MLDLLDYRRRVFDLYQAVRLNPNPSDAWLIFRMERDALFRDHPQSALDAARRAEFNSLTILPVDREEGLPDDALKPDGKFAVNHPVNVGANLYNGCSSTRQLGYGDSHSMESRQ